MSYRNDHDAAIARVDALTDQLDRTEEERDQLLAQVEQLRNPSPRATRRTGKVGFGVIAVTLGLCAAVVSQRHASPPGPLPVPAAAPDAAEPDAVPARAPSPRTAASPPAGDRTTDAARMTAVVMCADRLQRATADAAPPTDLRPLRATCRTELASLVSRRAAPGVLARWLALEDALSPSLAAYNTYILRDPAGTHYRAPAALRDAFDTALRARNAILPEVHDALHALDSGPSTDPLAHAIVETPTTAR